jgi:hypothetical protein
MRSGVIPYCHGCRPARRGRIVAHVTYEYGFAKPADWSDADVVAFATLANESDDDYAELAPVDVAPTSPAERSSS